MRLFLILFLLCSVANAADKEVNKFDIEAIDTAEEKAKLLDAVKAHFGETLNLDASQRLYCRRECERVNPTTKQKEKFRCCAFVESGTCTRAQFSTAYWAGWKMTPLSIDGDTVTYRRNWDAVEITTGARLDAVVAYLTEAHPDVTTAFFIDFTVTKQGTAIKSVAAYHAVIDEIDTAQLLLDGALLRPAPQ